MEGKNRIKQEYCTPTVLTLPGMWPEIIQVDDIIIVKEVGFAHHNNGETILGKEISLLVFFANIIQRIYFFSGSTPKFWFLHPKWDMTPTES